MGLDERIQEEMYVDTESLLEEEFDRAKDLFDIYEDNTVSITDQYLDVENKYQVLIHLMAWQYIAETEEDAAPGLTHDYFYECLDVSESTIRNYLSDLTDEGFIRENDDGNKELVVERLADVIDRIKDATDGDD